MSSKISTLFEELIINSWWVLLFMIVCYMLYEQGMRRKSVHFAKLNEQLFDLTADKKKSLALQKDLLLQINSQGDPAWVELILMKELGLVPEGHTKIYFNSK